MRISDRYIRHLLSFIATMCFAFLHGSAGGQGSQQSTTTDMPTSDPAARSQMELVLQALGGREAWRSVHTARTHVSMMDNRSQQVHEMYLLDDWSTDDVRYRRGVKGSGTPPADHSPNKQWTVTVNKADKVVQEFDQATVLLSQLPGAAAEVLLRRKEYVLHFRAPNGCPATTVCVAVDLKSDDGKHAWNIEVWEISKTTNLPTKITFRLHSPGIALRTQWETVEYDNFTALGGILYPAQTKAHLPDGLVRSCVYDAPTFNVDYASAPTE